jgi:hypothetical protein
LSTGGEKKRIRKDVRGVPHRHEHEQGEGKRERERELVREMFPQVLHAATISADQEKRGVTITKPVSRSGKVRSFIFTLLGRELCY